MPHVRGHRPSPLGAIRASRARVTAADVRAARDLARGRAPIPHKRAPDRAKVGLPPLPKAPTGRLKALQDIITKRSLTEPEMSEMERLLRQRKL